MFGIGRCQKCTKIVWPLSGEQLRTFKMFNALRNLVEPSGNSFLESLAEMDGLKLCNECYQEPMEIERSVLSIFTQEEILDMREKLKSGKFK